SPSDGERVGVGGIGGFSTALLTPTLSSLGGRSGGTRRVSRGNFSYSTAVGPGEGLLGVVYPAVLAVMLFGGHTPRRCTAATAS
ncbi:MAG: hypothetical protein NT167_16545, partial [Verrucomicrobia bacterium]|nr:hypothetical protein [Verrucomicrobiota bacterium]